MIFGVKQGWSTTKSYLLLHTITISVTNITSCIYVSQPCIGYIVAWVFSCNCCGSCNEDLNRNLFIANMSNLRWLHIMGKYIKSCSWFINPEYANTDYIIYQFLKSSLMCSIVKFAKLVSSWDICCLSQSFPTICCSLFASCDASDLFVV